jgi:hypothetical protein
MVGGLGTGMDDVRAEPAVARFRVEPDRSQWRMCTCRQCEWKWMASTAASACDVAPRPELHLVEEYGVPQPGTDAKGADF